MAEARQEGQPDRRPHTIPALREWIPGDPGYTWTPTSRIVLGPGADWGDAGQVVADDLEALTRIRAAVVSGVQPAPGDLHLTVGSPDEQLGDEGYRMTVAPTLHIEARTVAGAFLGTRTVLQLLRRSASIPGGVARDWPSYRERGMRIDTDSRKFSAAWWRNQLRDMSYLKLNHLAVALYGNGFTDPEIDELVSFAGRYRLQVVPVLSIPSHAEWLLRRHPSFALNPTALPPAGGAFDFTKPGALDIVKAEIERLIGRFPGAYWHTGADEYLNYPQHQPPWDKYPHLADFARQRTGNPDATGEDAVVWFLNWVAELVRSHGKRLRVWNDQLRRSGVLQLDPSAVVEHWARPVDPDAMTPQHFAERHQLHNADQDFLYYDKGARHIDPRRVYEEFEVGVFHSKQKVGGPAALNLVGAGFQVWTYDIPNTQEESNDEIAGRLFGPLRSLSQVLWGSAKLFAQYGGYGQGFDSLGRQLGRAPGYRVPTPTYGSGPGPGVAYEINGEVSYVLTRPNGSVQHGWQSIASGGPWRCETFPPSKLHDIVGDPVLTRYPDGATVLLARRRDGRLVQARQVLPGAGPWSYRVLDRAVAGRPAAVPDAGGALTFLARLAGGRLLFGREEHPGGPVHYTEFGSGIAGDPAIMLGPGGRLHAVARDDAGTLAFARQSGPGAFDMTTVGQPGIVGNPTLAPDNAGNPTFFARTGGGRIQHGRQVGGSWSYQTLGPGGVAGDPAAELEITGRLTYFARNTAGRLQHGYERQPGDGVFVIEQLGGGVAGEPGVSTDTTGRVVYFVRDNTGTLQHGWQRAPASGPWDSTRLPLRC